MGYIFAFFFYLMPIAAIVGSLLILVAFSMQMINLKKPQEEKRTVKKFYLWGFGLWVLALIILVPVYRVFYIAAGAAV